MTFFMFLVADAILTYASIAKTNSSLDHYRVSSLAIQKAQKGIDACIRPVTVSILQDTFCLTKKSFCLLHTQLLFRNTQQTSNNGFWNYHLLTVWLTKPKKQ